MELTLLRTMRGEDKKQSSMLMLMSPETRVPQTHPLGAIKKLAGNCNDGACTPPSECDPHLVPPRPTARRVIAWSSAGERPSVYLESRSLLRTSLSVPNPAQFCAHATNHVGMAVFDKFL